jgi:hypothetical protein
MRNGLNWSDSDPRRSPVDGSYPTSRHRISRPPSLPLNRLVYLLLRSSTSNSVLCLWTAGVSPRENAKDLRLDNSISSNAISEPNLPVRGSGEQRRSTFRDRYFLSCQSPRSVLHHRNGAEAGEPRHPEHLSFCFAKANWRRRESAANLPLLPLPCSTGIYRENSQRRPAPAPPAPSDVAQICASRVDFPMRQNRETMMVIREIMNSLGR